MDLLSFTLTCHQTGYVQSHAKEQQSQGSCEVTLQNNEKLLLSSTFSAFTVCGRLKKKYKQEVILYRGQHVLI